MKTRILISLVCSTLILCVYFFNDRDPEQDSGAKHTRTYTIESKQPSSPHHTSISKHNKLSEIKKSEKIPHTEVCENTWSMAVIRSLKTDNVGFEQAIDHIARSVLFMDFAALDHATAARLIRYAQYVRTQPAKQIPHLCWGYDTATAHRNSFDGVRALAISENGNLLPLPIFQGDARWSLTGTDGNTLGAGTPVTITWSFIPDGTIVPDGGADAQDNETTAPSDLIAKLNTAYGSPTVSNDLTTAPWFEFFENAFTFWAEATGNVYIYEPNDSTVPLLDFPTGSPGIRGDVRIGGTFIDGNSGTLAFNYFPNAGDMVIDSHDSLNLGAGQGALFTNVIAHEHGHGLGLSHVCPINQTKLMEPFASSAFLGAQFDDELTAQELYGDPLERQGGNKNNNSSLTANNLGVLSTTFNDDRPSIANNSDVDFFRFQLNEAKMLTLTVTPTSQAPYLEGEQNNFNGSCAVGTLFDPRTRQDLSLRVLDSDGNTLISSSNSAAIGNAESITNLPLHKTSSNYYIEVNGGNQNSGSGNNTQAYTIDISLIEIGPAEITAISLTGEACLPPNNVIDPNEEVTIELVIENNRTTAAENLSVSLTGSANLNIIGNSLQNLPDLAADTSTTISYTFSLSGNCGDTEALSFRVDADTGFTEFNQEVTLGTESTVNTEDFDSTVLNSIPTGYSESSALSTAKWRTVDSLFASSPNAVFAPGKDEDETVNSAYLSSPLISSVNTTSKLHFDHYYNTEENYDGGVLEISIDNGLTWNEWTAEGGTFIQNGYSETIALDETNPIKGQEAWTGISSGFITTIAKFPTSAIGQNLRVRWHMSNDQFAISLGWYIDNIRITQIDCCDNISIPALSVTAFPTATSEFTPSTTADFIITSDIVVNADLDFAYTLSGEAVPASDFIALAGTATILTGEDMTTIPVTAVTDSEIEGDETLTLTLSPSVNYGIVNAAATVTIQDLPFDEYRDTNFGGSIINIADDEDFDFDGIANLIEYAFRLSPTLATTLPFSLLVENSGGQTLELTYYEDTEVTDINYIVETSTTLAPDSWTTTGVVITNGTITDGLQTRTASISVDNQPGFIRIRIERIVP